MRKSPREAVLQRGDVCNISDRLSRSDESAPRSHHQSDDYEPSEGARFEVHFEKSRGIFGEDAAAFEARLETRDGAAIWIMREIEDVKLARAQALFAEGSSVRDVAEELGISKSAAGRLKTKLEAGE